MFVQRRAVQLMSEAIEKRLCFGRDISFGIDAAASEFYHEGKYKLAKRKEVSSDELQTSSKNSRKISDYSMEILLRKTTGTRSKNLLLQSRLFKLSATILRYKRQAFAKKHRQ